MSAENSEPGPSKDNNSFFKENVGAMDTQLTDPITVFNFRNPGSRKQINSS